MDASRADLEYMIKFTQVAIDAGATTINFPDTVGYAVPEEWGAWMKRIVEAIPAFKDEVVMSMHTHNDLGLATCQCHCRCRQRCPSDRVYAQRYW